MGKLDLLAFLDGMSDEAFRLEMLPIYSVPQEAEDVAAFLDGALERGHPSEQWYARLRAQREAGRRHLRLRILPAALTPYLLFEIEWGYTRTVPAGEEILFLSEEEFAPLSPVRQDFWMVDRNAVALMEYSPRGAFLGCHLAPEDQLGPLLAARDLHSRGRPLESVLADIRNGRLPIRQAG